MSGLVFVFTLLAIFGLLIGEIIVYIKLRKRYFSQRSTWISTIGKVTYAKHKHYEEETGGDNCKPEEWTVWVDYSYDVAGKHYTASQDWSSSSPPVQQYSVGSAVTVYYNPIRPKKGVLNRGIIPDEMWWGAWVFIAVVIVTMALLVFVLIFLATLFE